MVTIQRPLGNDVSVSNSNNTVYLGDGTFVANESTNKSIRFSYAAGSALARVERKLNDVWNNSSFGVSGGSVEVGLDFTIGGAGSFIETFNEALADAHQKALIPHIPFTDAGTQLLHTPILDVQNTDIIYSTAVSETAGTSIGISFNSAHARFVSGVTHQVGATGGSAEVKYSIYSGTDNSGILIQQKNLPASDLVADSALVVEFTTTSRPVYIGFNENGDFFIELTSDSSFSLKTDSSGNPLMSFSEQHQDTLDIVTNNEMVNASGVAMRNLDNEVMFARQFR